MTTLEERTDAIEGGLERAAQAQAEANRLREQFQAQLAEARHEAARLREQAIEEGAQIIAARCARRRRPRQARIIAAAHTQIDADRQQAFASLRAEIGTLAVQLAEQDRRRVAGRRGRQSRVVDRFLADLDASRAESSGARASS